MGLKYTIRELGTFGGEYSEAYALNSLENPQVVGMASRPFWGWEACLWQAPAPPFNLGAAWTSPSQPSLLMSVAAAINSQGKAVGWTQNGMAKRATLFDGTAKDLTPMLGKPYSIALDINANNVIVGNMGDADGESVAFVYDTNTSQLIELGGPGTAKAVNSAGHVAGVMYDASYGGWQAFVYRDGQMTFITPGPGEVGNANDINNSGVIVGEFDFKPFIYNPVNQSLKTLDVEGISVATAINDAGTVVGTGWNDGKDFAWVYTEQEGVVDLNTCISSDLGWTLSVAADINNFGVIVGRGDYQGKRRGFVLTPVKKRAPWWSVNRPPYERAIDPMALILSGDAYHIWTEIHHPHEPKVSEMRELLLSMTKEERIIVLNRAQTSERYAKAVEEAYASLDQ